MELQSASEINKGSTPTPSYFPDRFWKYVSQTKGCWEWQGARQSCGYGHLKVNGRMVLAHRLSFAHFYGPIPAGLGVLHLCDNPPCVNPMHLRAGNQSDNNLDAYGRGRRVSQRGRVRAGAAS